MVLASSTEVADVARARPYQASFGDLLGGMRQRKQEQGAIGRQA
jgi:hypothetical protein